MRPEGVIAAWMTSFLRRRYRGVPDAQTAQPDRAAALGALGEALVAGALREHGLADAAQRGAAREQATAEIDLLARAPNSIVVFEVKTWSGIR